MGLLRDSRVQEESEAFTLISIGDGDTSTSYLILKNLGRT